MRHASHFGVCVRACVCACVCVRACVRACSQELCSAAHRSEGQKRGNKQGAIDDDASAIEQCQDGSSLRMGQFLGREIARSGKVAKGRATTEALGNNKGNIEWDANEVRV
eukprot:1149791-Pelagomonas_calceolata.AAC.4